MKLEKLWESYDFYTKSLTEHSRKLAFAVAVICWFFKSENVTFPWAVTAALACVVLYFTFDLLQYYVAASITRSWAFRQEAKLEKEKGTARPEDDVENPPRLDAWPFRLFHLKLLALSLSFGMLTVEFTKRLLG